MLIVFYLIVSFVRADNNPIVNTAIGTIRGVRSEDGEYNMYMGIPYARVNYSNPFGPSLPYPEFDEIFEANDDSSICPQREEFNYTIVGDLDCLRVNIYTPTYANSTSGLPIFVWFYGGGFNIGFYGKWLYGPRYLVRYEIVFVTVNYRVGPYGFMCLDIPEVPGNEGLKDQITALRWLKLHINALGGDPNRITVGGNSAGGEGIDFHLHRDKSDEILFEKVILESGSCLAASTYTTPLKDAPIVLAKNLGFHTDDIYKAIAFLAKVPPKEVIRAEFNLGINVSSICLEKRFADVESYLSVNWFKAELPSVRNMSVMVGVNDDELGMVRSLIHSKASKIGKSLKSLFYTEHVDFQEMEDVVNQFYLDDGNVDVDVGVVNFLSDIEFIHPMYESIYKYLNNGVERIYFYNFSYVGNRNFVRRRLHIDGGGAYHADEISYLFDMKFLPEDPGADDQLVIDKMTKLWTNFVKYGDPTPEMTELIDVKWEPIRQDTPIYNMNINTNLSVTTSQIFERVTFWDVFLEKYGHLQKILSLN